MCLKTGSLRQLLLMLLWLDAPNAPLMRSEGLNMLSADDNTYCVSFDSDTRVDRPSGNHCVDDGGLEGKRKARNGSHWWLLAKPTPAHRHIVGRTIIETSTSL